MINYTRSTDGPIEQSSIETKSIAYLCITVTIIQSCNMWLILHQATCSGTLCSYAKIEDPVFLWLAMLAYRTATWFQGQFWKGIIIAPVENAAHRNVPLRDPATMLCIVTTDARMACMLFWKLVHDESIDIIPSYNIYDENMWHMYSSMPFS